MYGMIAVSMLAAALLGGGPGADEPASTGTISGRVVDHEGAPAPGAKVWAIRLRDQVAETTADDEGRFRLGPIEEGRSLELWAEAPGLAREHRQGVIVLGGIDREIDPLPLLPGTRIAGRAVDAEGRPIAGAEVDLKLYRHVLGHTISSHQTEWSFTADDEGRFATPPLPAGRASFVLAGPGKARTNAHGTSAPGSRQVDLGDVTLPDETPIRGVVVDQDGEPALGVLVFPDYDYDNAATTDDDGRFVITGVGDEAKQLNIDSDRYFTPDSIELGPGREDLTLTVTKAFLIEGSAVDAETGEPVAVDTATLCIVVREDDGSYSLQG